MDRLPQIRRLAASGYCAAVASGVRQLLPELDGFERDAIVRGVLRHRAFNRAVHRFHLRFPRVATVAARFVPTTISAQVVALLRSDRPILVAGPHIGPVFFVLTVLLGALRGRSVYVLHSSKTQFAQRNAAYLQRVGVRSVLEDDDSLRTLSRALKSERRCTVVICFDHLAEGRRNTTLFRTPVAVSYGIAYLADVAGAAAITACWDFAGWWPRLVIGGPYEVDRIVDRAERHVRFMNRLFGYLETQVRKAPQQWTEWQYVDDARARLSAGARSSASQSQH